MFNDNLYFTYQRESGRPPGSAPGATRDLRANEREALQKCYEAYRESGRTHEEARILADIRDGELMETGRGPASDLDGLGLTESQVGRLLEKISARATEPPVALYLSERAADGSYLIVDGKTGKRQRFRAA